MNYKLFLNLIFKNNIYIYNPPVAQLEEQSTVEVVRQCEHCRALSTP